MRSTHTHLLTTATVALCTCLPGRAQGADDCASATPITGTGLYAFDNTGATNSGVIGLTCSGTVGTNPDQIPDDVWFTWTAPNSGDYDITTCNLSPVVDTKLAVYDGNNCATSMAVDCNDDANGCANFSSRVFLTGAVGGQSYLIQVGVWAGENGGAPPFTQGVGDLQISSVLAPPNDNCSMATPISGPGPFNFDNLLSTTDGLPDGLCLAFGTDQISNDLWYLWTAGATGPMQVTTCGGTALDTRLAVYDDLTCPPAIPIACNDDSGCGLQSTAIFNAIAGTQYRLRVGTFSPTGFGSGTFVVDVPQNPPGNDDCSNATAISGVGTFPWDSTNATTDGLPDGLCLAFGTDQISSDIWFRWTATTSAQFQVDTCTLTALDTRIAVYDDQPCPAMLPLDCNDDTCGLQSAAVFSGTAGASYLIRVGSFSVTAQGSGDILISEVGGPPMIGMPYCMSLPNSSNTAATITAMGSTSVAANSLALEAQGLPAGVIGIFYYGTTSILAPFGDGFRCVGGVVQRLPFNQASASGALLEPDVFALPMLNLPIGPGTFHFQSWFRDPQAMLSGFNLSNGVLITFVP